MRYSGIAVLSRPADVAGIEARIAEMPGVEVYARDAERGRVVVVQEADDLADHEARLRAIQAMPGVVVAELVVHVEDADGALVQVEDAARGPAGVNRTVGRDGKVAP